MSPFARRVLVPFFLVAGVALGVGLARSFDTRAAHAEAKPLTAAALQDSFAAAADAAVRSVVHITTRTRLPDDLWQPMENVGSGVIVSDRGHILTNHHVIESARALRVRFVDGKEFSATVVGRDPETDLALLKIEGGGAKFTPAEFADSDPVRVGDWCLAIGSPFGYNHTVTAGIVSAKHRRMTFAQPYQDFLQTDAAINPGNSGGALVNLRGQVIGINTAIVSPSRGNDGVGLAISSNLAGSVRDSLLQHGRVRRGYLGVVPADFSAELVEALEKFGYRSVKEILEDAGLKEPKGVYLLHVQPGGPAAKAGLKDNDIILEFGGKPVAGQKEMFLSVAEAPPGTEVEVRALRDRKTQAFRVTLGERPPQELNPRPRR